MSGDGHNTVIVDAILPFGHHPEAYPEFDRDVLAEMAELLESYHEDSVVPDSSVASSAMPDSSVASSVVTDSHRLSSITHSHDDNQPDGTNTHGDSNSLHHIQLRYPQWQIVLVRMRILMRIAVCRGECGNPFLLTQTTSSDTRARFIANLFKQSLTEVGIPRVELCCGQ